jgi:hypothetical protein
MKELTYNQVKPGAIVGNFQLVKRIETFEEFWKVINKEKSIFARNRVYPAAFFHSWMLRLTHQWIKAGYFYTIKRIENAI